MVPDNCLEQIKNQTPDTRTSTFYLSNPRQRESVVSVFAAECGVVKLLQEIIVSVLVQRGGRALWTPRRN